MRIRESRLRRIIREEARKMRRSIRESADVMDATYVADGLEDMAMDLPPDEARFMEDLSDEIRTQYRGDISLDDVYRAADGPYMAEAIPSEQERRDLIDYALESMGF